MLLDSRINDNFYILSGDSEHVNFIMHFARFDAIGCLKVCSPLT